MGKVGAVHEVKPDSNTETRFSIFSRGSEIVTLKMFNRITSDPKKLWHINDFKDLASDIVIRRRLKELVDAQAYGEAFQMSIWTEQLTHWTPPHWGLSAANLGGGQFFSHGCHYVDILLWFMGRPAAARRRPR